MTLDSYQGLPVLVTGHTGFKGAWLCTALESLGAQVYGYALEPEKESLYSNLGMDISSCYADIRDFDTLCRYMNTTKPRIVFHLAAQALVSVGRDDPLGTFSTNIMGLVHVLEASARAGVDAVVVVSTDKVYAPQEKACRPESKLGGVDPYSASKTAAEFVIAPYRDRLSISVSRSGNAIGGGDWAKDRLFPDIIRAYNNKTPLMLRYPNATRPWIHVSELVYAYLLLGLHNLEGRHTEVFNFGAKESLAVHELIQCAQLHGISPSVVYCEASAKETQTLSLDTKKSEEVLGWHAQLAPRTSIEWTVKEYLSYTDRFALRTMMLARIGCVQSKLRI